ncbi:hypothetical protein [Paraburkholderia rhizosphaerae]|uniref:Histone H1-like nucleoprotein HC2 n=1 Tax=Paraburkholderia rhizosphaerae TaxID=480658 RepID=A0A4R8M1J2_9BURK|nr:hypothetical protein [Paraburkholderia rhizosphaerae]TDY54724.1 hypothetical protein BX592_101180 [Paraburkholderia rhizosphaerae]
MKAATEKAAPAKGNSSAGKTAKTASTSAKTKQPAAKTPKAAQVQPAEKVANAANVAKDVKNVKEAGAKTTKDEKARRVKKDKVVRDSFTMPKSDYAKLAELKQRCLDGGVSVKKSELLRAGLTLLAAVPPKRLIAAVSALDTVKTGRPAKS